MYKTILFFICLLMIFYNISNNAYGEEYPYINISSNCVAYIHLDVFNQGNNSDLKLYLHGAYVTTIGKNTNKKVLVSISTELKEYIIWIIWISNNKQYYKSYTFDPYTYCSISNNRNANVHKYNFRDYNVTTFLTGLFSIILLLSLNVLKKNLNH